MIKIFLVEDEIIMREGIRNNIAWEREGFEFVGEASDGELAYPLIQKTRPDILITDIRMPFMDGLELSRLVKQEMPEIKIIILTGYDEFEYAQASINIGITEYLLKPVNGAKLLETVRKVGQLIEEEKEQREFLKTFEQERRENVQLARQKFFRKIVLGRYSASEILQEGRKVGLELGANRYNILLFQLFAEGGSRAEMEHYTERQNTAMEEIERIADDLPEVLMIELGIEGWAFIVKEVDDKPLDTVLDDFIGRLQAMLAGYSKLEYFGGVGEAIERVSELNHCFETANRVFASRYLQEKNQILRSTSFDREGVYRTEELELGSPEIRRLDRGITERFLKTGLRGEVSNFVEEYFGTFLKQGMQSLLFRQYVAMDLYFTAVELLEKIGCDGPASLGSCGDLQVISARIQTPEGSKEYLKELLENAIEKREEVSQRKYHSLLTKAKEYIEQHFDEETISLNSVAASVNLSPNHFSTIFSQEMGQTFIEYLTTVRMERAKELLRSTSLRTAEVAFSVGYKDPHYFSYLFKKTQECTPTEFRRRV